MDRFANLGRVVMCGRRLAVKHFLASRRLRVGCSHVYGLLVQPFTTAGPDVVREGVLIS